MLLALLICTAQRMDPIRAKLNRCLFSKLRAFYAQLSAAKLYDYSLTVGGPLKRLRSPNTNQNMPITINMAIVT